jgi:hypothetical protein
MSETTTKKRPLWRRILKWSGIAVATVFAVFILVCSLLVWCLTPGRLTPMVEKIASESIDADVSLSRVELTFWHTFPKMTLEMDSLRVVSRSLHTLPDSVRATLPADADSLLSLPSFHAGVNVFALLGGHVSLYDVVFTHPEVNLLQVDDSSANYLIAPPQEASEKTSGSSVTALPRISINRFAIVGADPLRFRSLKDSVDVAVAIENIELKGDAAPRYRLGLSGNLNTPLLRDFNFDRLTFGADGAVTWNPQLPMAITIDDFVVSLHDYSVKFATKADFTHSPVLTDLKAETSDLPVAEILSHLPVSARQLAQPLQTDMRLRVKAALTTPWNIADSLLPSFSASVEIPSCEVRYETLNFHDFSVDFVAEVNGRDMDKSVFTLRKLIIDGEVVDVDLSASATDVVSDAAVEGAFKGAVDFGRFPRRLRSLLPGSLTGVLSGATDFRFRLSDLNANSFHRMKLNGKFGLDGFEADFDSIGRVYANHVALEFGSNNTFVKNDHKVDSLLTISLKADTLAAAFDGMNLQCRGLRAGAGTSNRSSSADTTAINPFGMVLAFDRLNLDDPADTLRCRLRNASVGASLRRYKGEARVPQLSLKLDLGGLIFGQALTKVALREAMVDMTVNMRPRRKRVMSHADSLRVAAARLRRDSVRVSGVGTTDLRLSADDRKLLRRWDFNGIVKARSGRLVTPYFPLRNRLENVDFKFNQDSLQLRNLVYKAGGSDFLINGTVSNLRKALTSRRDNTLGIRFVVVSDTINVNQIVDAVFAGSATAQQADSALVWSDDDRADITLEQAVDTAAAGPVLLPRNLDAIFAMRAKNVLYSDLQLHSFRGDLLVDDGVLNLRNLSASTGVGALRVDGMYAAQMPDSLRFGLGLKVTDFRLDRLTSIVPAIDSILPVMKSFEGIVNADLAVTTDISPKMDIELPTLRAAMKIEGDSLVLLDADTFKTLSKWLMFQNKKRNMIDHMAVEVVVENSAIEVFPFMFDIDRYKLGVMGHNDLAMNLDYHVSVLKSPVPFKFGINIKGTPDDMKIRLGGAKVKDRMVGERQTIAADTRINLVEQINRMFRSGIKKARSGRLSFPGASGSHYPGAPVPVEATDSLGRRHPSAAGFNQMGSLQLAGNETMTVADSLRLIRQGLIPNPDPLRFPVKSLTAPE